MNFSADNQKGENVNIIAHPSGGSTPTRHFDTTIKVNISGRRWSWIARDARGRVLARQVGMFPNEVAPEIALRFVRIKAQAWQLENNALHAAVVEEVVA